MKLRTRERRGSLRSPSDGRHGRVSTWRIRSPGWTGTTSPPLMPSARIRSCRCAESLDSMPRLMDVRPLQHVAFLFEVFRLDRPGLRRPDLKRDDAGLDARLHLRHFCTWPWSSASAMRRMPPRTITSRWAAGARRGTRHGRPRASSGDDSARSGRQWPLRPAPDASQRLRADQLGGFAVMAPAIHGLGPADVVQ